MFARLRRLSGAVLLIGAVWQRAPALLAHAQTCAPRPSIASADERVEAAVFDMINAERSARGLPPFVLSAQLTQAARRHSTDMASRDFFSHEGSDRSDFVKRIDGTCYRFSTAAENIAGGYGGDLKAMVKGWMDSPPHRESILSRDYTEAGVGYATNLNSGLVHFYTMNFGTQLNTPLVTPVPQPARSQATARPRVTVRPKRPAARPTLKPTARVTPAPSATPR
jgi:uncharacterized protein YkwD